MIGFTGFSDPQFWQVAAIGLGIIILAAGIVAFPCWAREVMHRGRKD